MVESGYLYCTVVLTASLLHGLYPGGVKTGELVHTSKSQDGVW